MRCMNMNKMITIVAAVAAMMAPVARYVRVCVCWLYGQLVGCLFVHASTFAC